MQENIVVNHEYPSIEKSTVDTNSTVGVEQKKQSIVVN